MPEQSLPVPKKPTQGVNDLATVCPEVAKLWHPTKNTFGSNEIMAGARRDCFWLGECGHEWEAAPRVMTRVKNGKLAGCPVCKGRQVVHGINDLASQHPEIAKEWHPTKNEPLTAEQVTPASAKRVWWFGQCGHEWQDQVVERTRERRAKGCRVCIGAVISVGFNDFATTHPEVAKFWHPTKNSITPQEITYGIRLRQFWWLGECGHEWETKPAAMTSSYRTGSGCPYCSGKKLLSGFNDLDTRYKDISKEWHPSKNSIGGPHLIVSGSSQKVWWLCCTCKEEWLISPMQRTSGARNSGCPRCPKNSITSQKERMIFSEIKKFYPQAENSFDIETKWTKSQSYARVDIFIPEVKTVIEYDGSYWHKNKIAIDKKKTIALLILGYKVIRVRENPLDFLNLEDENLLQIKSNEDSSLDIATKIIEKIRD